MKLSYKNQISVIKNENRTEITRNKTKQTPNEYKKLRRKRILQCKDIWERKQIKTTKQKA